MFKELWKHHAFKFGFLSQEEAREVSEVGFYLIIPPKTVLRERGQLEVRQP